MVILKARDPTKNITELWWRNLYEEVYDWAKKTCPQHLVHGVDSLVEIQAVEDYLKIFYPSSHIELDGKYYSLAMNEEDACLFCLKFMSSNS